MPARDAISWNTIISGYAQNGDLSQARRLFDESPTRDMVLMLGNNITNDWKFTCQGLFIQSYIYG
jgi:pentatricopeptide repeat protein